LHQQELSKRVAREWHELDAAGRAYYDRVAEERKEEHKRLYPGYKYQPKKREEVQDEVRTRARTNSTPTSRATPSVGKDLQEKLNRSRFRHAPPIEPNFTTLPSTAFPTPYSPFANPSAATSQPSPSHASTAKYVPVPVSTFRRLVNTQQPPSRTVNPTVLRSPHLLAYSSMAEFQEAVAFAEGRKPHPGAGFSEHATGTEVQYVPVPVRSRPSTRSATAVGLVAYPSMRALQAEFAVADESPAAFLETQDPASVMGLNAAAAVGTSAGHRALAGGAFRYPTSDALAPFLDEETRWRVEYPGMPRSDRMEVNAHHYAFEGASPRGWEMASDFTSRR
ncbi:hypothetical protein EVJ58_g10873, partial [Rhodofomes roseus]